MNWCKVKILNKIDTQTRENAGTSADKEDAHPMQPTQPTRIVLNVLNFWVLLLKGLFFTEQNAPKSVLDLSAYSPQ